MRKTIIGVMGPGDGVSQKIKDSAYLLGELIAKNNWIVLNGGRNVGVMDAVSHGAKNAGGFVLGILPTEQSVIASDALDIAVLTGIGDARNNINVLTADIIVACGMNPGTASEVALALKIQKPIILLECDRVTVEFFQKMSTSMLSMLSIASSAEEAVQQIKKILTK